MIGLLHIRRWHLGILAHSLSLFPTLDGPVQWHSSLRWNAHIPGTPIQPNIPLPAFLNAAGTDEIYLGFLCFPVRRPV